MKRDARGKVWGGLTGPQAVNSPRLLGQDLTLALKSGVNVPELGLKLYRNQMLVEDLSQPQRPGLCAKPGMCVISIPPSRQRSRSSKCRPCREQRPRSKREQARLKQTISHHGLEKGHYWSRERTENTGVVVGGDARVQSGGGERDKHRSGEEGGIDHCC